VNPDRIQALLVEADATAAANLQDLVAHLSSPRIQLVLVTSIDEACQALATNSLDVVLLGTASPGEFNVPAFSRLHRAAPALPIVVFTDSRDDETSLLAVREGAQDYLVRGEFDGRFLARVLRYAIERKAAEARLRQNEEFFRLISENVTDLIAVVDRHGRRLYNNPAYERSLLPASNLEGTDSFQEIHPDDQERIRNIFHETLLSGTGRRTEYRMRLADGSIRHIESLGNVIRNDHGQPDKVVVVSRDITDRIHAMNALEQTLGELRTAHEALKTAQTRLVQSEKIEALSTFAAGIAHEVRNPLQTILLGIDFLRQTHDSNADPTVLQVLTDLENGARRADAVIQGLLEFTSYRQHAVTDQDLSQLVARALHTVDAELAARSIHLVKDLAHGLPRIRVDGRKIRHVLIKLFLGTIERLRSGGSLSVRTYQQDAASDLPPKLFLPAPLRPGEHLVLAEIRQTPANTPPPSPDDSPGTALIRQEELDLLIVKKVVELYGGMILNHGRNPGNFHVTLLFRTQT
jgi:PAS domain S-box-containing protein